MGAKRAHVIAIKFVVAATLAAAAMLLCSCVAGQAHSPGTSRSGTEAAHESTSAAGLSDAPAAAAPDVQISPIPSSPDAFEHGQLIVGLAPESDAAHVQGQLGDAGFPSVRELLGAEDGFGAVLLAETDGAYAIGEGLAEAARAAAGIAGVEYVQPNYRCSVASAATKAARDEDAAEQYYLNSWAESRGADVVAGWGATDPAVKVDVAVLDTGMYSMEERDGAALVTANPKNYHQEFDAGNLDMAAGVDFVHSGAGEALPLVNEMNPTGDDNGHGTHVAAIIAANARTEVTPGKRADGIAGVSPNARIVPVKVLDANGDGDVADCVSAFNYLLDDGFLREHNLRIINMSLSVAVNEDEGYDGLSAAATGAPDAQAGQGAASGAALSPQAATAATSGASASLQVAPTASTAKRKHDRTLQELIKRAKAKGIVTVCAAGNMDPNDKTVSRDAATYPSDYKECISVMALDEDGNVASYSHVNASKDIAAPGSRIYSAWANQADSYKALDGTSQAAAIVSGTLSTMWAARPGMTVQQARRALYAGGTNGKGVRILDAAASLARIGAYPFLNKLGKARVEVTPKKVAYTGKKLAPDVTVVLGGRTLTQGVDYTVKYKKNLKPGKARVVVRGAGAYRGVKRAVFRIALGSTKIKKVAAADRGFTVKWKRQKAGKVGYQVRYSLQKSMKGAAVEKVRKNAKTKLVVRGLEPGERYYVQVRTYRKIAGKAYYSKWSPRKSVVTGGQAR